MSIAPFELKTQALCLFEIANHENKKPLLHKFVFINLGYRMPNEVSKDARGRAR